MRFDISRLRRADGIVGVSAIAFFIFLFFFEWLGGSTSSSIAGVGSVSSNGWRSFPASSWIWLITIIVALGSIVLVADGRRLETPLQPGVIVLGLGALSSALILFRIIHHPSAGASAVVGLTHLSYSYGLKIGIWLGLLAAVGIAYGGYLQLRARDGSTSDARGPTSGAFSGLTVGGGSSAGSPPARNS
jgi:hypothetical protein